MAKIVVRKAKREDCDEIMRLLRELADFENISDWIKLDAKTLEKDGFDTDHPFFHCIVAEDPDNPSDLIGYALFYIGYASWNGKRIYLEDIMVTEKYRRAGIGTMIFTKVCQEAIKLNCKAINFIVADWNPANEFYKKFGTEDLTNKKGYHFFNLDEDKLNEIAKN
uniref:Putative diamine acetyltransferase n=1 Tax=Panstrongylus megistus TaxID=65343 RepID=A0A069DNH9_9HEMI